MTEPHPYADATYRVMPLDDGLFGVEVTIPEMYPTMVTGLASIDAAEAWIADHKTRTSAPPKRRRVTFAKKND